MDGTKSNWYALYLCITKKATIRESLRLMDLDESDAETDRRRNGNAGNKACCGEIH